MIAPEDWGTAKAAAAPMLDAIDELDTELNQLADPDDPRPPKADLTMAEYELAHRQWVEAGMPRASFGEITAPLAGGVT